MIFFSNSIVLFFEYAYIFFLREMAFKNANSCYTFVFKSLALCRVRFHCSRGAILSNHSLRLIRKVISVYGARLISYRSHIFIATTHTRAYLCTDACARNDTRLWPRDRIRSEGWKNTVAAVFCERVESSEDEANVGSATVHTLCIINCDTKETDTSSLYPDL